MGVREGSFPTEMTDDKSTTSKKLETPKLVHRAPSANYYGVVDFKEIKIKRVIKCVERTSSIDYFVSRENLVNSQPLSVAR